MARRELIHTAKAGDGGAATQWAGILYPDTLSWLSGVAKAFERIRWHSATIIWRPAVGTTTNGMVAYGADWTCSTTAPTDRAAVLALTPVNDHPIWQSAEVRPLVLPVQRLQSRAWYVLGGSDSFDKAPCSVFFALSSSNLTKDSLAGELWIAYDVVLSGTRKV